MGLSVVTGPVIEPVSLAEAKAHLRVIVPDEDAIIAGHVMAARRFAENYIRGAICTQTWDATFDYGWPTKEVDGCVRNRIELPLHPVQSVTTVSYVDDAGSTQVLTGSLYTVHRNRPVCYIERAYQVAWPAVRVVPDAVTVRFVAGYLPANVPDDIRSAILLHVEALYDRNPADRESLEFARDALLDPHRVLRVS